MAAIGACVLLWSCLYPTPAEAVYAQPDTVSVVQDRSYHDVLFAALLAVSDELGHDRRILLLLTPYHFVTGFWVEWNVAG